MTNEEARHILMMLADGIDPITGEILPDDHLCNNPMVIRALYKALLYFPMDDITACPDSTDDELAQQHEQLQYINKNGRLNAGRPWTEDDLALLYSLHCNGTPIEDICKQMDRRKRGVIKALYQLGLSPAPQIPQPRPQRIGKPWTAAEKSFLKQMAQAESPIADIAAKLERTRYAVYCKMESMGICGPELGYPPTRSPGWLTNADRTLLAEMHEAGSSIHDMALRLDRSEASVSAHLFYMGLSKDAPLRGVPDDSTNTKEI